MIVPVHVQGKLFVVGEGDGAGHLAGEFEVVALLVAVRISGNQGVVMEAGLVDTGVARVGGGGGIIIIGGRGLMNIGCCCFSKINNKEHMINKHLELIEY